MGSKSKALLKSQQLTTYLRQMALEACEMSEADGVTLTKGELLAKNLWRAALGWTEEKVADDGKVTKVWHRAERWAMEYLFNRIEGKIPDAVTGDDDRVKAAEEVTDLAKKRVNDLAKTVSNKVRDLKLKGPPRLDNDD